MPTKLDKLVRRSTGIVINDGKADRELEVVLRLGFDGKPEIAFRLKGLKSGHVISVMDAYDLAVNGPENYAPLVRPIKFASTQEYKDGSKRGRLAVVIAPDDSITTRLAGTHESFSLNLGEVHTRAQLKAHGIVTPTKRKA